jgi:hypothetical protein
MNRKTASEEVLAIHQFAGLLESGRARRGLSAEKTQLECCISPP